MKPRIIALVLAVASFATTHAASRAATESWVREFVAAYVATNATSGSSSSQSTVVSRLVNASTATAVARMKSCTNDVYMTMSSNTNLDSIVLARTDDVDPNYWINNSINTTLYLSDDGTFIIETNYDEYKSQTNMANEAVIELSGSTGGVVTIYKAKATDKQVEEAIK